MAAGEVHVRGLRELQQAFKVADKSLSRELRKTLRAVAEPVRVDAEHLAVAAIPHIGIPWSRMRVGVTTRSVYVAPKQRGARMPQRKRPNLAGLLLGRSMEPALAANQSEIVSGLEHMLDTVGHDWEEA